jgi:SAM-dependent methyltransferase
MSSRRKTEWFDEDALWRDTYDFMFGAPRFEEAREDAARLLALVKPRGRDVLDLCCGPGRFCVPLAKRGYRVTGVDRTRFLLDRGRALARRERARVEWIRSDMRDFVRPGSFDLALSMYTSFGYFENPDEDMVVLRNVLASLRPGSPFVVQTMGKERLAKIYLETTSEALPDGRLLVCRHEAVDDWTRNRNEWILIRDGRAKTFRFSHTVYSGRELRSLMESAGFVGVRLYGDLAGAPYDRAARWLVAVGRAPGGRVARRRAAGGRAR